MAKLNIFISYAHEDESIKNDLDKFLITLKRSEKINLWQDRQIHAGDEWDALIKKELVEADIILLLVSVDFIASEYIWRNELKTAMERHEKGEARVIPIIARACDWSGMPFRKLQALPVGAKPINSAVNKDEVLTEVAKKIREVVDFMLQ
ncbi:MAG: toll/interleukin-1 receptor domain-containing protein [Saprospiraceae bacterium]|nr:toll/interleukin-1 receptor domain-containing protein [Saprospiraceae bacterium]MBK9726852.1 toll/interleukin-1 receptor domain-containing protein [Saprospiraceae bacterium]